MLPSPSEVLIVSGALRQHARRWAQWVIVLAASTVAGAASQDSSASGLALSSGASPPEPWSRYQWDTLYGLHHALAEKRFEDTVRLAATAEPALRHPSERMWLEIYRGYALDALGQRATAKNAYATAFRIYPHQLANAGLRGSLRDIEQVNALREELASNSSVRRGSVRVKDAVQHWVALVPENRETRQPLLLRIGHPADQDAAIYRVLALRRHPSIPRGMILAQSDVLASLLRGRDLLVDDPELGAEVPARFSEVLQGILQALPVDERRVYLMGYSFDAVWAWRLGLAAPKRFAGVIALSAVSYPKGISDVISAGGAHDLPVCVLRGDRDSMFPQRLEQERRTGNEMMRQNRRSLWQLLPNTSHAGVWAKADLCFARILGG